MKKIPTIFERDWNGDRSRVLNIPHPSCAWVFAGEGIATQKIDGTCCLIRDGKLFKRREIKSGQVVPTNFETSGLDEETGKTVGWVPVGDGPEDQYHRQAFNAELSDGTYELIGPKLQGNPEKSETNQLVPHNSIGLVISSPVPRTFDGLKSWFEGKDMEGIVFHHPDGRMAKIKLKDFGIKRGNK